MDKTLIEIRKIDGRADAMVDITSEDDFMAAVVCLSAILHKKKRLGIMVVTGLLARMKNPDSFDKNEIIVPGGMPWDNK